MVNGIKKCRNRPTVKWSNDFNKGTKATQWRKEVFSTNGTGYPYRRKRTHIPTSLYKQKIIQDVLQTWT